MREVELASFLEHLIVGDVADGAAVVVNPIAQAFAGVAQQLCLDADTVNLDAFFFQVAEIDPGGKLAQGDGEVDPVHLSRDELAHRGVALVRTKNLELISLHVQRGEEGDCVDVIPVGMRDENAGA